IDTESNAAEGGSALPSGTPVADVREPLLDKRLDEEPVDAAWAPLAVTRLYSIASAMGVEFTTMDAVCRTSICRLEVTPLTPSSDLEDRRRLGNDISLALRRFVEENIQHVDSISVRVPMQLPYTEVV